MVELKWKTLLKRKHKRTIHSDAPVDLLIYGMGEKPVVEIADAIAAGRSVETLTDVAQTALVQPLEKMPAERESEHHIVLYSYDEALADKRCHAENFKHIEVESNRFEGREIWQRTGDVAIKVNRTNPPMTTAEIDASFDLPYTRLPHPRYNGKRIPAYEMIRHSVNMHRGCFGGCAFCTISAHQGKFIASRSKQSIMREVRQVTRMDDFKGYISDLGGPSANMYMMSGLDHDKCRRCVRPSCLHPTPCPNLKNDHAPLLEIYKAVDALPDVKRSFIGSGVRYDLAMHRNADDRINACNRRYIDELIMHHVSGRLKVAPEHTSDAVLKLMRKPSFSLFEEFKRLFDEVNEREGFRLQLIPYFISSHPGCHEVDMAELAVKTKKLHFHLEQVQDFTPTPMTVSTEMYYTGYNPYTLEPVFTATTREEKLAQRKYFFWYEPEYRRDIYASLSRLGRRDIIAALFGNSQARQGASRVRFKKRRN